VLQREGCINRENQFEGVSLKNKASFLGLGVGKIENEWVSILSIEKKRDEKRMAGIEEAV